MNPASTLSAEDAFLSEARSLEGKELWHHFLRGWEAGRWKHPIPADALEVLARYDVTDEVLAQRDKPIARYLEGSAEAIPLETALKTRGHSRVVATYAPSKITSQSVRNLVRDLPDSTAATAMENVLSALAECSRKSAERLIRDVLGDAVPAGAKVKALETSTRLNVRLDDAELKEVLQVAADVRAADARELAGPTLAHIVQTRGRVAARNFLFHSIPFISEDVDVGMLEAARRNDLLIESDLSRLPPRLREQYRGHDVSLDARRLEEAADVLLFGMAPAARVPVSRLLTQTSVDLVVEGDDFTEEELARLAASTHRLPRGLNFLELAHALRFDGSRFLPELRALESLVGLSHRDTYQVTALRLLHMRGVLSALSLADAVQHPTTPILPHLVQLLSGDRTLSFGEHFSYERSLTADNPRWFRNTAEEFGEAFGILFLEDVVELDLTRVNRIPEGKNTSADFFAQTTDGKRVVLETKGGTSWGYFNSSRKKALQQLGKSPRRRSVQPPRDRAFLSRLFLAQRGGERKSRLAVEDPPIDFDAIFDPAWEHRAKRAQASATLHFAGFPRLAAWIAKPEDVRGRPPYPLLDERRLSVFEHGGRKWSGTTVPLAELASLLSVPTTDALDELSVFRGVDREILDLSLAGRVAWESDAESAVREHQGGVIDGPDGGRGVYSILSNGSMLGIVARDFIKTEP